VPVSVERVPPLSPTEDLRSPVQTFQRSSPAFPGALRGAASRYVERLPHVHPRPL